MLLHVYTFDWETNREGEGKEGREYTVWGVRVHIWRAEVTMHVWREAYIV